MFTKMFSNNQIISDINKNFTGVGWFICFVNVRCTVLGLIIKYILKI
nr:hypothetical protein CoNPh37_CDS0159 [Staphylococcus phage S-CoN_Ph37]